MPPQNRRNRPRNDYNDRNFPEEDIFDRGINLEERNRDIGPEPNPRPVQGQDLRDTIFEVLDQAIPCREERQDILIGNHILKG